MNEVLALKQTRRVMSFGIPKRDARDMVMEVISIVGSDDIKRLEASLDYAIDLSYRIGISQRRIK